MSAFATYKLALLVPPLLILLLHRDMKAGEALVATSAEDSTVRLWDLRDGGLASSGSGPSSSSPRVVTCLCRCFGGEAVSSVVFGAGDANRLYCSAGGKVGVVRTSDECCCLPKSRSVKYRSI